MALLTCPDCDRRVSDAAASCPNCGRPMAGARSLAAGRDTVTTQRTSKPWKLAGVAGGLLIVVGIVSLLAGAATTTGILSGGGVLLIAIGLLLVLLGRLGAWWFHA